MFSIQCFVQKVASLPSTCAPGHTPHITRIKRGWIFSETGKLLKIQYLMSKCSRQFVQPLLQERTLLAWNSQPACGLGKKIEHFCTFVKIPTDKQLSEGTTILEWMEETKRKNWGTSCCGCSRQCKRSKRFTTFLQSFHESIFCTFQWDNTKSTVYVARCQLRAWKLLRQNTHG